MELNMLPLLLHSVYYRAFGYPSKDEQSNGNGDDHHHEAAGMFMRRPPNKDDQMMFKKCGGRVDHVGRYSNCFQMPLHYPRYKKSDYEKMDEWKVDMLLNEYGISYNGTLEEKRAFAMGAFLWPDQI